MTDKKKLLSESQWRSLHELAGASESLTAQQVSDALGVDRITAIAALNMLVRLVGAKLMLLVYAEGNDAPVEVRDIALGFPRLPRYFSAIGETVLDECKLSYELMVRFQGAPTGELTTPRH